MKVLLRWAKVGTIGVLCSAFIAMGLNAQPNIPTKIYWTEFGSEKARFCEIANCTPTDLAVAPGTQPVGVALDGAGNVYWAQEGTDTIRTCSIASCTATVLITSTPGSVTSGIALGK